MKTEHTPIYQVEEYQVPLGAGHYHVVGSDNREHAYFVRLDDAKKFVKAVNSHDKLTRDRDALLAALKQLCHAKRALDWSPSIELVEAFAGARAAIAQAESEET